MYRMHRNAAQSNVQCYVRVLAAQELFYGVG
jgi:hypothetical protein